MSLSTPGQDELVPFFERLATVITLHDLNNYKADHRSAETTLMLQELKQLIASSPSVAFKFSDSQLLYSLFSQFASKDVHRAYTLLLFLSLSGDNQLITNNITYKHHYSGVKSNEIKLSGMDNWCSVLCYFDSLLFAMFGRLDDYDDSLLSTAAIESSVVKQFKLGLRLFVNLMRSGEGNITTDLVEVFCKIFAELGFKEATSKKQQDVISCFESLCDFLGVPMLTLKMDIIHSGKVDINDDLKYMNERVLFISVPEEKMGDLKTDTIHEEEENSNKMSFSKMMKGRRSKKDKDEPINLEECLDNYFNNSVKVKRVLQRRRTLTLERSYTSDPDVSEARVSEEFYPENSNNSTAVEEEISIRTGDEDVESTVDRDLLSADDLKERNQFLGIVSYSPEIKEPVPVDGARSNYLYTNRSRSSYDSLSNRSAENASPLGSLATEDISVLVSNNSDSSQHHHYTSLRRSISSPLASQGAFKPSPLRHSRRDSISKINEIITLTRSRSSTDASTIASPIMKSSNSVALAHTPNSGLEVTLPAWMFLQLMPYYSDLGPNTTDDVKRENAASCYMSDEKVSIELVENTSKSPPLSTEKDPLILENSFKNSYFDKRPIVPICLKRYIYNDKGKTQKINKKFIIPLVIDKPYFIADDKAAHTNTAQKEFGRFKLVLESVVCHRGSSIDSGHYIAASRKYSHTAAKGKKNKEEDQAWLLFNDLKGDDEKVIETTFKYIMDTESPYLLFYRLEEYDLGSAGLNHSSASTLKNFHLNDNASVSTPPLVKEKTAFANNGVLDPRELRKNSVISTLSQVSSLLKKEKDEGLRLINSTSSNAGSVASSTLSGLHVPSTKTANDVAPTEDSKGRLSHHTFAFSRSLSRSSSRPPLSNKKDFIPPDSPEFVDYTHRYYWYYENEEGKFKKQSKFDTTHEKSFTLKAPFRTVSQDSDASQGSAKDQLKSDLPLALTYSKTAKDWGNSSDLKKTPPVIILSPTESEHPYSNTKPVSQSPNKETLKGYDIVEKKDKDNVLGPTASSKPFLKKKGDKKGRHGKGHHDDKCIIM